MYFDNHAESQWLRFCASTAEGMGSIPGREDIACHGAWQKKKKKKLIRIKQSVTYKKLSIKIGLNRLIKDSKDILD